VHDLAVLFLHLLATVARLAGPGGARSVVAESVLVKQQLLILNRSRKRSPNLRFSDRMVAGVCALLMRPRRLIRSAIVLKPSTLLSLHRALTQRKYRRLFSSTVPTKPCAWRITNFLSILEFAMHTSGGPTRARRRA
jgi:putative transposase